MDSPAGTRSALPHPPAPRDRLGPALILAAFAALVAAVGPFHNFPVQDDWDYARTVAILLRTGTFQRSEIAQASELFSALWGALFAGTLGFSFDALRASTLVLSALALLAFYAILGELGFERTRRLAGTLTLLAGPLFVFLSFSFMTDVPTLFWLLGAIYCYLRALRQADARLAAAGSACATLAFLTRQIGLVSALAAAAYFFVRPPSGRRVLWTAAAAALPLAAAAAYTVWVAGSGGITWANAQLTFGDTLSFIADPQTPAAVVRRALADCLTLAFYLAPLWLLALPALRMRRSPSRPRVLLAALLGIFIAVGVGRLALRGEWLPYLTDAFTRQGLRPYLGYFAYGAGSVRADILPLPVWVALTALAAGLGWLLLVVGSGAAVAADERIRFVAWFALCLAVPTLLFREFYERFLLPFLPLAIILVLDATRRARSANWLGLAGAALLALFSLALMKDYWGWMDARWPAAQSLVQAGVPLDHIDAGYEWDGWNLYEQSMDKIRQQQLPMQITPWAYVIDPEYLFAFSVLPHYHVERTVRFDSPFGPRVNTFFILKRDP